jgi:mRNA interferase RelE/StbE
LARIEWTEAALEDLERLDRPVARRILTKLTWFSENLQGLAPEALGGIWRGAFRFRIGDWRVVYTLEGETIKIQFIGHRSGIYRTG